MHASDSVFFPVAFVIFLVITFLLIQIFVNSKKVRKILGGKEKYGHLVWSDTAVFSIGWSCIFLGIIISIFFTVGLDHFGLLGTK